MSLILKGHVLPPHKLSGSINPRVGGGPSKTLKDNINITPTTTAQDVFPGSGYDGFKKAHVYAIPTGSEGTPVAIKSHVVNHAVTITPSVENQNGFIAGGSEIRGEPVTVDVSELVSGTREITENGEYDITPYENVEVNVDKSVAVQDVVYITPSSEEQDVYPESPYQAFSSAHVYGISEGEVLPPIASKNAVYNHSITVVTSVGVHEGYVQEDTIAGNSVTVSASELVSGSETKTANGTYDVTNLKTLVVNVTQKQTIVSSVQSARVTSTSISATSVTLTIPKTGNYVLKYGATRNSTSSTPTVNLHKGTSSTAISGTSATFSSYLASVTTSPIAFTANDKITIWASVTSSSYPVFIGSLIAIEQ